MKYLIYFLLFSTVGFSQNYQYSIEEAQNKPPIVPTGLIASQITQTSVNLTWTAPVASATVKDYGIYSENILLAKSVGSGTTYKVTGLTPETIYSLTVRATDNAGVISADSNVQTFSTVIVATGVNNQLEEIEYFKAYLLPLAQKANLQNAINTYNSVRLEKGDYSGVNIVMKSNQKLYGHPSLSQVSGITISAGSTNIHLEQLFLNNSLITFEAGGIISDCVIKTIKWTTLAATNAKLENNTFINVMCKINFDCSSSGYFRNNKIIRMQSGTHSNLIIMKGNSTTPSYGNVHLWTNLLTPHGNATDIDGLQSATFVGLDAESWNFTGDGTKPMFYAKNMGNLKITDLGGANGGSQVKTPPFDISANELFFMNKYIQGQGTSDDSKLSANANVFYVGGAHDNYVRNSGTFKGFDFKAHIKGLGIDNQITYNGTLQSSTITNTTISNNLKRTIQDTQYTPWTRPNWEILPDPLGTNWIIDRVGKPDQRSYIQNLINTNKMAELPEGIFYIGSTLQMPMDNLHGIVGKGTGKTVIVALKDDFPVISLVGGRNGNFTLANLTLQGGRVGIYASTDYGSQNIAYQNLKFVIFRNQNYGIHLNKTGGFDNNFLENLSFVNCSKGFFQEPTVGNTGESNSAYVDKTMFYKNQFINCNIAVSMRATRADNLNAWVDCKFDGNNLAFDLSGNNFPIAANCDFTNHKGENIIRDSPLALYSCNFYNNATTGAIIRAQGTYIEGCNLLDNIPVFSPTVHHSINNYILNSTIAGSVIRNYGITQALYVNSKLLANPTLSKLLVNVKNSVPTVVIDATPNPYPQLLVTQ